MADPIPYSRTQRVLLLIDLHPTTLSQNPGPYLRAVRAAADAILTFPSISSSLFSFKFFYSSLPLILYPTKPPLSLRFDQPAATLGLLAEALASVRREGRAGEVGRGPKAVLVDSALRQILHDYAWEGEEWESGAGVGAVRSNLVVVLSPVGDLAEFMDLGKDEEALGSVDKFVGKFGDVFDHVREGYARNDIHLAWIDVKSELQCAIREVENDRFESKCDFFQKGLKSLGWGYCSTDSVLLGSALVQFGMIYPLIGLSPDVMKCDGLAKKCRAQLNLEISDVRGKPLECKCCYLELVETNLFSRCKSGCGLNGLELENQKRENEVSRKTFLDPLDCNATIKFRIQAVMKYPECDKMVGRLTDIVLVRGSVGKSGDDVVEVSGEFYADRAMRLLRFEMNDCKENYSGPMWHILLSYLYKESYWGIVSSTDSSGNSSTGILKPFTIDSALLFVMDSVSWPQKGIDGLDITKSVKDADVKSHTVSKDGQRDIEDARQTTIHSSQDDGKMSRKCSRKFKNLNWSAFCKMAYERFRTDIGDVYFSTLSDKSKKLKFLQCWMKQIKKCSSNLYIPDQLEPHLTPEELNDRLMQSLGDSEQPLSTPTSVGENTLTDCHPTQDAAVGDLNCETPQDFIRNLSSKIHVCLDTEGLDLGAFAERIVKCTMHSFQIAHMNDDISPSETTAESHDTVLGKIAGELTSLLLVDPKDMKARHKHNDKMEDSDTCSSKLESESTRRRYELQILFRMEIIRSQLAPSIAESVKHKFVKQICQLLERIQCIEGGFFGDWSLDSYLAKLLKSRYSNDLEETLHQIYSKMDLLLFSEEDENLNFLPNSEDSSQPLGETQGGDASGENEPIFKPLSADNKSQHRQLQNKKLSLKANKSKSHILKLAEAEKMRERARRFSSFTSWIPDLQKVWTSKQQPQLTRSQSDLSRKHSKRPCRHPASSDMVFETPETNKKSCSRRSVDSPCNSVSKALFQDIGH
uniref:Treslin n=1 Tax=Kalanchoe fedtschenkoi TaxID=63787 RepID=A0A7N0U636_KALFE